ncbi:hypothetical protein ACFXG4_36800 [Nocardia sp. NPDC059246]|uniref:hypothetical protein n=1 Tax=unclassified Nocardia TaxID=2637762 RepID=UPI0036900121
MDAKYPIYSIGSGQVLAADLIFGGLALVSLLYCVQVARRRRTIWPVAVFGGSMLLVFYEPLNNLLAHCAYPTGPGQHEMLTYFGQHVPWSTWFIYMFYFSYAVPDLIQRLDRGMTPKAFAAYYAVVVVVCAAFEPAFANVHGLRWWYYYGDNQAFNFTGLPMFWWFANAMVVVGMAVIFHLLKKHIFTNDLQSLLFIPLAPLVLFGVHGSAATPVFIAIPSTDNKLLTSIATLATVAISLLYVWLMSKAACIRDLRPVAAATKPTTVSA